VNTERKPLDATAIGLMVALCLVWGLWQVIAKLAADGVSLVLQSGIRSAIATVLLWAWALWRATPLFGRDGTLGAGILAGLLFGGEFLFIFMGLAHTAAARMVVFIYFAPCMTALGLHWLVPGERLRLVQWTGVALAFAGIAVAFGDGFAAAGGTLLGDLYGVIGALLWAATTVLIRATKLASISATKTLFYQLAVSAVMLLAASWLLGEPGITRFTPLIIAALAYQSVVVAFASYLIWFWLLRRYLAGRLAVFSFLTPLFGVAAGVVVLGEPVTVAFIGAALLVGLGIVLVNAPKA
jgi:drug/metabolite transporter (DMT)-like permease